MTALDELIKQPCRVCGGAKVLYEMEDIITPLAHIYNHIRGKKPCPDCQENGEPTGLEFWWLTRKCWCSKGDHTESVEGGRFYHRVPLSKEKMLWELLEQGHINRIHTLYEAFQAWADKDSSENPAGDLLEALAAAWLQR